MEEIKLTLKRIAKKSDYTIGKLYINGSYFCDTLEDKDRRIEQTDSIEIIKRLKIWGNTAIPIGTYDVNMDIISPKYSNFIKYPYTKISGGKIPRLMNVKGFEGILIHAGNSNKDTDGCILVGKNKQVGRVIESQITWINLYQILIKGHREGKKIKITIE